MEEKYILLYGDKKPEDNICLTNMFENSLKINLGWTDFDYNHNVKIIEDVINNGTNQLIFAGLEVGWEKLIRNIRNKHNAIKIKVICNTQDSLLYYEYERENFFSLLKLSKENIIDDIAFLKKGQYEMYNNLGYKCSYLMQNFILGDKFKQAVGIKSDTINIGIYPLNYTWDKNIFNQLCIPKFIDNSILNYNKLDERMKDFIDTMQIESKEDNIDIINAENVYKAVTKNDVNISCSFTEYFHPVFFISMESGIPCLIGNTSDLFNENDEIMKYIVTKAEDNPIINSSIVIKCIENKKKIIELYKCWKEKYNIKAKESIEEFIKK